MDDVQRLANRVTVSFVAGMTTGSIMALGRNLPVGKTAFSMATSCAMVGTACFGLERVSNIALRQVSDDKRKVLYISHAMGGAAGGSMVGALFQHRTIPGLLLFTPAMLLVAFGEIQFEKAREVRLREMIEKAQLEQQEQQQSQ